MGNINTGNILQRTAHRHKFLSLCIEETNPKRRCHAAASIIGTAAAQPHHYLAAAILPRFFYQLPHPVCSGYGRITVLPGQGQACTGRHLYHGRITDFSPERIHHHSIGALHTSIQPISPVAS